VIVFPICVGYVTRKHFGNLHSVEVTNKYGPLFEDISCETKGSAYYTFLFMTRRFLISLTLIFLREYRFLQLQLLLTSSLLNVAYILRCSPFEESKNNRDELFNELCIYLSCLSVTCFMPNDVSAEEKATPGWALIGICLLSLTVNLYATSSASV